MAVMSTIAYYLRDAGNLHYFAALKPYLDHFVRAGRHQHRIVVRSLAGDALRAPEYAGYAELFSDDCDLGGYDLVLTPTFLRDDDAGGDVRAVQVFHGMSDKPFTYERDFGRHLLCLAAGQRQVDRLRRHACNRALRIEPVGYPKFDRFERAPQPLDDSRKTLIYCPTWRKGGLSSVQRMLDEPELLRQLGRRYNLVVKPHPNLLNPAREHYDAELARRLHDLPGATLIHRGNVLPWMARADLFIGDISAAGYEWLYFDRPMVFVNPQPGRLARSDDIEAETYLWRCGAVCDEPQALPRLVEQALARDEHRAQREALLHYSVRGPRDGGATRRATAAVERLLSELPARRHRCVLRAPS